MLSILVSRRMAIIGIWLMWSPELQMNLQISLEYGNWQKLMSQHNAALWDCQIVWQLWGYTSSFTHTHPHPHTKLHAQYLSSNLIGSSMTSQLELFLRAEASLWSSLNMGYLLSKTPLIFFGSPVSWLSGFEVNIYKFRTCHFSTSRQCCAQALEMASKWTPPCWKGNG